MDMLNSNLGTNYGYLAKAGLGNVMAHTQRAKDIGMMINDRGNLNGLTGLPSGKGLGAGLIAGSDGRGLTAGRGLYASNMRGRGLVGRGGGFVSHQTILPPALQSQPFGANFQLQHTLPPQFQKFNKGGVTIG
jgi:hypothetical protein